MVSLCQCLIAAPIPEPHRSEISRIMNQVAAYSGKPPPYAHIEPHVTFCRPLEGVEEGEIVKIVTAAAANAHGASFTLGNPISFGKHYIVLPVHVSLGLALLWGFLHGYFSVMPEYRRGEYELKNILHVTIAEKTTAKFDELWPKVREIKVPEMRIKLDSLAVYRKLLGLDVWEKIETFPFSA